MSLGLTPRATDFPEIPFGPQQTEGMQKAGLLGTLVDSGFIACWFFTVVVFQSPKPWVSGLIYLPWEVLSAEQWLWPEWGEAVSNLNGWELLSFYVSLSTVTSRTHEHKAVSQMIFMIAISP